MCAYRCAGSGCYLVSKYIQNLVLAQLCVCMCYMCMHIYVCVYVCVCIHVCANVHGSVHVHVYMCMYVDLPAQYTINITHSRFIFNRLLINFKIILLFCRHVQHQSFIGLPTVIIGNSLIQ